MAAKQRTVLIVEDRDDFRPLLERGCKMAFSRLAAILREIYQGLPEDGLFAIDEPADTGQLLVAADEQQARTMLIDYPHLDCASVDLALAEDEYELDDDVNVGGMRVLHELHTTNKRALAVVVSGEKAPRYPVEATLKHKVIGYCQKARFDLQDYSRIITAALLYQEALDHITSVEAFDSDPDNLEIAQRCWMHAQQVVAQDEATKTPAVDLNFPEDLGLRIEVLAAKLDRITRLPTGDWLAQALKSRVIGKDNWVVLRVQLDDFERFRESYTYQVDSLRQLIASAIKKIVVKRTGQLDAFVGLLGQEYLPAPCFIVILAANHNLPMQVIEDQIRDEYREHNLTLLPATFIKEEQQKHTYSREELRAYLQQFLPQPTFTMWDSRAEEDFYAFPDALESISTLTHLKPERITK